MQCYIQLLCILAAGIVTQGLAIETQADDVDNSPHAAALELIFASQQSAIAEVDRGNRWHDVQERQWLVKRPFYPGVIDSTHLFEVDYRIDGKVVASWLVDTRKKSVTRGESAPAKKKVRKAKKAEREQATDEMDTFAATAAKQALDRYLTEVEEIERVATKRKELARERLANSLEQNRRAEEDRGRRFRGMLGTFYDNKGRIPFILLTTPNGSNVYDERMKSAMNGRYEVNEPMYRFEARGHVTIPAQGTYRLETGRGYGQFKLNDISYNLSQRKPGEALVAEVELDQGTQEVYFRVGNNGGQMHYSLVRIIDIESGKPLPIFIYEADLKDFHGDLSLGVEMTETSGWSMKENRLE